MGVSICAQIIEIFLLCDYIESGNDDKSRSFKSFTLAELIQEIRKKYGLSWDGKVEDAIQNLLQPEIHGCGVIFLPEQEKYQWQFAEASGTLVKCTDQVETHIIEGYSQMAEDFWDSHRDGWAIVYQDAVKVYEDTHQRTYAEALVEMQAENARRMSEFYPSDDEPIPF